MQNPKPRCPIRCYRCVCATLSVYMPEAPWRIQVCGWKHRCAISRFSVPGRSRDAMPAWTLPLLACCGRSPIDFESITLATRSPCFGACSFGLAARACQWGYGATVVRLTPDQKVGSSILSVLNGCSGMLLGFVVALAHMCCSDRWACVRAGCARLLRSLLWDSNPRPPAY